MRPDDTRTAWRGRFLSLTVETWAGRDQEIVEHPGSVAVVAVDQGGRVVLVRQLRAPARAELLELPAGTLDRDEEPEEAARRELAEETGLRGGSWRSLGSYWTSPGFVRERLQLFLAEGLEEGEPDMEDDEQIELVRWSRDEVERRLGELGDMKTLAGLLLYLRASA